MALWMEAGTNPTTEHELQDLEAINALKEAAATELREKGNEYVKKGKNHYAEAINCYTRAINQKIQNDYENSLLYGNRAHVNLLLGNYRRALSDAEEAIKYNPKNVKAYYRGAKAAFALDLLQEARTFCTMALEQCGPNLELQNLEKQVITKQNEIDEKKSLESKALSEVEALVSALESRNLKIGPAGYKELVGVRKPWIDKSSILHWPVLLLYGEVMSSDFIEDFCENDIFASHIDMMFSEDAPPLAWDANYSYTREAVELYYLSSTGPPLSKTRILRYLLEGASRNVARMIGEEDETDGDTAMELFVHEAQNSSKWVKVNEQKKLLDVLQRPDYIIPGIPVFYVVSRKSSFYSDFISGRWFPP